MIHFTSLRALLSLRPRETVSLVGAGGKTTFMYTLAHELVACGQRVLTTTTTKIRPPSADDSETLWLDAQGLLPVALWRVFRHITCIAGIDNAGKAIGVAPETVDRWHAEQPVSCLIVEADGAREKPLKAPDIGHEPVVPTVTSICVVITGIDAIGRPLVPEYVHRPQIVSRVSGICAGDEVTPATMAAVIHYYLRQALAPRVLVFLNKVKGDERTRQAQAVCDLLPGVATAFGCLHDKNFFLVCNANKG